MRHGHLLLELVISCAIVALAVLPLAQGIVASLMAEARVEESWELRSWIEDQRAALRFRRRPEGDWEVKLDAHGVSARRGRRGPPPSLSDWTLRGGLEVQVTLEWVVGEEVDWIVLSAEIDGNRQKLRWARPAPSLE